MHFRGIIEIDAGVVDAVRGLERLVFIALITECHRAAQQLPDSP